MSRYRYPWPASAITAADMALLHRARQAAAPHIPITELIAQAVREACGHLAQTAPAEISPGERREAA